MSGSVRDPQTLGQWQLAVDAAEGVLALELARLLGLIDGGAQVDADRCAEIIDRGENEYAIVPSATAIRDFVVEVVDGANRTRILNVVDLAIQMSGSPRLASVVPFLAHSQEQA